MKKAILISLLFISCAGAGFVYYSFNKPHRNAAREDAAFTLTAEELFKSFDENEAEANKKYLDKVVQVKGTVSEITKDQKGTTLLILKPESADFGVNCAFRKEDLEKAATIKKGDIITVKGICNGGGGLMDVGMNGCEILE